MKINDNEELILVSCKKVMSKKNKEQYIIIKVVDTYSNIFSIITKFDQNIYDTLKSYNLTSITPFLLLAFNFKTNAFNLQIDKKAFVK